MTYKENKELTEKVENLLGTRYCSNCLHTRPIEGGKWLTLNNGRNRRWKCQSCTERANVQKQKVA